MIRCLTISALLLLQAGPPQGPVLYWKLDEAAGAIADDAFGANDGAHTGGTPSLDRPTLNFSNPQSRSYDGVDDATARAASGVPAGNSRHTIAMWIKVNALPANRAWIALLGNAGAGSHHWLIDKDGATQFGVWGGAQRQPVLAADGLWRHVATTFDGTTLRCFVNGVEGQAGVAATFSLAGVPFTVAQAHNNENAFNGVVDDVRLYSRDLSASEVQYLAAGNGPPAPPANLAATPAILSTDLSWDAVAGAVSYTIHRTTTLNDPNPPVVATVDGTTYSDPGLSFQTTYYYVIRATHSVGDISGFSNVASATPLPIPPRTEDHEEGFLDDNCACGASARSGAPFLALLGALLALGRRRR
jgi:hypothetical protein